MNCSKVRFPLLMGAMLAAALPAYSQQPTPHSAPTDTPAPAASTTAPAAAQTTASDSASTKPSEETVKKAKSLGLRPEVHKGVTVYCWEDASVGTRFPTKKCADENQLNDIIAQREQAKEYLRQFKQSSSGK